VRFDGWKDPVEPIQNALQEHGWIVLEGLCPPDDLVRYQTAFQTVVDRQATPPREVAQWTHASQHHPAFVSYLRHRLWTRVAEVLGVPGLQLLQDVLLYKPAGSTAPIAWHRDHSYTGYLTPDRIYSVRMSLQNATGASGCLEVMDRSHHWPMDLAMSVLASSLAPDVLETLPSDLRARAEHTRTALPLPPGGMSIHHCKTVHGSFANTTLTDQQVIVCHVFDSRCRLDASKLPPGAAEDHFPTDAAGHLCLSRCPMLATTQEPA
jgi:ectoine hydroxylase-related dioxygenase (phytanoyl-CoA dioxygenase family)